MRPEDGHSSFSGAGLTAGLVLASILLLSLSFPNPFFTQGLPFCAWCAFALLFSAVRRFSLKSSPLWGALFGALFYLIFNYWLTSFHPLAGIIVSVLYALLYAILFFFLVFSRVLFPRWAWFLQSLLWLSCEYVKTTGFLGYPYGVTGYSQWTVLPLIQIASVTGVWGVSALVVCSGALASELLSRRRMGVKALLRTQWMPLALWALALAGTLVGGLVLKPDTSRDPEKRIALIQHNSDPWKGALTEYRRDLDTLCRLSDQALASEPDLVVWPETAFAPRIYWHRTYREDSETWLVVKELLDYLALKDVPFLIGNDDARKKPGLDGEELRVDYNAALLFEHGVETAAYRKMRLVPFTEYFPYRKLFPFVYTALIAADTHFWEAGTEATVFEAGGFRFSAPICFEDSFGSISRHFVQEGAGLLVCMTNDAWAHSLTSQTQHASMAVFRAVENRRSLVRSSVSGQTLAVAPDGRVMGMATPFSEAFLVVSVPIHEGLSFYSRYGDWFAVVVCCISAAWFFFGVFRKFLFGRSLIDNSHAS